MPKLIPALPTMSLGYGAAGHDMPTKLRAAAEAGFKGIEVFYPCLEAFASSSFASLPTPQEQLRAAAKETKRLADELGLDLFVLQPLMNYDGILDEKEHAERRDEAVFRMELCDILDCDMMQMPASFRRDDGVTGDEDKIVADLRELADLGAARPRPIRIAYESLAWSTFFPRWQDTLRIVRAVDRPNFGLVLDAFHIGGFEFADPASPTGERPDAAARLSGSLAELVATVPREKVYYLQLADAVRLSPPLLPLGMSTAEARAQGREVSALQVDGQDPRMSWSRTSRLFPGETDRGGYLPVWECARAFLQNGWEGYVSFELFNSAMSDPDPRIPQEHAQRANAGWEAFRREIGFE
ncbi:hypothetical protein JCM10450v2_000061 [Rhodotorula kratochvilovae]